MAAKELYSTTLFSDSNLQAYYRLEGNANDSKNSNNLSITGSPSTVAGQFGNALDFEYSSTQYAKGALTAPTGAFTIMGWMNIESVVGTAGFLAFGNSGGTNHTGIVAGTGGNTLAFYVNGSSKVNSDATFSTGTWFLGAVVNTGTTKKVWINDTKKESSDSTTPSTTSVFGIATLGDYASANADGIFDDVSYFDRALSDNEVLRYYRGASASVLAFF